MTQRLPDPIPVTEAYYEKVKAKEGKLTEYRKEVLVRLQAAREMGDLSENGAYKAARFELSDTDRELRRLRFLLRFGRVTKATYNGTVDFGSIVTITSGQMRRTFSIVSNYESDPKENKVSPKSPLGKALMGKRVGDTVKVQAPAGEMEYRIEVIE
jgi:transcription elongation factor GreA